MPRFIYKVRDKQGRERKETQESASQEELIGQLQNQDLIVTSIVGEEDQRKLFSIKHQFHSQATVDDLIIFSRQLATMLDAGVTLLKSLEVLGKQIESVILLRAAERIKQDISSGSTFRDALAKHPRIFSDFWVHMVGTGEASGALPATLRQLANYLESAAAVRSRISSALVYPSVLIALSLMCLAIFTVWIIPIFSRVFENFDAQLPALTLAVIFFSGLLRRFIFIWSALGAGAAYLIYKYLHTEQGKWHLDRLKLRIPVLSTLFQRIAIERFASALGTLIDSGVPLLYALDVMKKATGNKVLEQAIGDVRESVRQGKGMAGPLEKSGVFTPMVVQMVSVGEEIGELGKMLKKISEFYGQRIATTLTRLITLVEPAVLVFMGLLVGVLVVSMFLPIFQLAMVAQGG